ncbi:MAG TPA: hypothetical protein VFF69_11690 [Phycisphaerales bacterium]|nr:hypothetical protein [Phycisphaerales bacterium]
MPSSFKSKDLFGSGPHRFAQGRQGQVMLSWIALGTTQPGTLAIGLTELDVIVAGRLVAPNEAALWLLREAITAELQETPTPGTLIDLHARQWPDMSFIDYREADRTDRARFYSLSYTATFRRIREY